MPINTYLDRDTHTNATEASRLAWLWLLSVLVSFAVLSCGSDVSAPAGGDEPIASVSEAVTSQTVSSDWNCPTGESCEDNYGMDVPGGTLVTIRVTQITGNSFLRLWAFTNADSLNLLTGAIKHWNCNGTGTDTVTFKTPATAMYRIALGRDAARSTGTKGSYTVTFETSAPITFRGRLTNDLPSIDFESLCGWENIVNTSFSCTGPTCQNVWDYDVQAGSAITLSTGAPSSTASLSQRLHAPGVALGGHNLLIGTDLGRRCAANNQQENASIRVFPQGRYRVAITQEGTSSGPSSGNYRQTVRSDKPMIALGQTVFNGPGNTRGVRCKSFHTLQATLSCPTNVACMDYSSFSMFTPAVVEMDLIQSNGLPRVVVYPSSGSTNQLNNTTRDRQCKAANQPDFAATLQPVTGGAFRVGVGRSSGGTVGGDYILNVLASQPFTFVGNISNDVTPNTATSCP